MDQDIKAAEKKLTRSITDRILFGVCGGLADFFETEAALIRLIFILLTFAGGTGIVLYIILAILLPRTKIEQGQVLSRSDSLKEFAGDVSSRAEDLAREVREKRYDIRRNRSNIFGFLIVLAGAVLLAKEFLPIGNIIAKAFWPGLIIAVGLYLIFKK